jgi:hypothetical protein
MVVGRTDSIDIENNKCTVRLRIPINYNNVNGEDENDIIKIQVFNNISDKICEYCKVTALTGIKGMIQSDNVLIAEKVSFLSSKSE